jgi:hypothetical protein
MPKSTAAERRAWALCAALVRVTDSRPMQYRIAQIIAQAVGRDEATAEVAIVYAVEKEWLIAEGNPPHSVCLTDEGRILSATLRRAR